MERRIKKSFVKQLERADCGVACLSMLIKYYGGGEVKLQTLREFSGTNRQGTTVLGIVQGAEKVGLDMEAFEGADFKDLRELTQPAILHVVKNEFINHFYVFFGYENGKYLIGDPEFALRYVSEEELAEEWQTRVVMLGKPNENFIQRKSLNREKINWVKELVKEDLNVLIIALVLGILLTFMGLATAIYSQQLIDVILPSGETKKLVIGLSLFGFILLFNAGLSYVRSYLLLGQSRDFNNRIINRFYGKLLYLPKLFFDNRKVGEMVARMNDTSRIQGTVSMLFTSIVIDILMIVITTIFVFSYSPPIGFLSLISFPLYFGIVWFFNQRIIDQQRLAMQAYAKNEANYVDTIQGIVPIKEGNKERVFAEMTRRIYGYLQKVNFDLGKLGLNISLVAGILGGILNLGIIAWASFMVLDKDMQLGEMMAILQMSGALIPAVGRMASVNIDLQEARVAFDRMYEFAGAEPEYREEKEESKALPEQFTHLEMKDLTFRFIGRPQLLKGISLHIKKGEMIALLGESGCGKSTLLQILQRFYYHENGAITVDGRDWSEISTPGWRQIIATVPQEIKLFNGSLIDNIALGGLPDKEVEGADYDMEQLMTKIVAFCEEWGFADFFNDFPQGFFTILGEEGVNISGGQRQLVAIARALYQRPQLLLLDEATSAMDRKTESKILKILQERKDELAIILVTHRLKTATIADRIYVIEEGNITANGSHQELMQSDNFYSLSIRDLAIPEIQNADYPPATDTDDLKMTDDDNPFKID